MKILVLFDNRENVEQGIKFINSLGFSSDSYIKVLIGGKNFRGKYASEEISKISFLLFNFYRSHEIELIKGRFLNQAILHANSKNWDLIVYCEIIPAGFHLKFGSTHKCIQLVKRIHSPLLLVRNEIDVVTNILVCTSAEPAARITLSMAGKLLRNVTSTLVLLHVMSQVQLTQPGLELDLLDTAESAIERESKEGKHFISGIKILRENGYTGIIKPKLRHGLILDEVLSELQIQQSELMVIGSHHQAGKSRLVEFLLEDVTKILISETQTSVLVIE